MSQALVPAGMRGPEADVRLRARRHTPSSAWLLCRGSSGWSRTSSSYASYGYDGDGLRAGKTVDGTATAETWDVAEGLPLLLQDGATRYIDGPGGTPIEQVDGAGNAKYYLQDHLGSARGLVDGSGTITDSYSYDPYGQRTAVTGSLADTPFGYAGQYTDAETGFQYLRARYYDPATGQFLTVDPLVDSTGHPYAYAGDNPANFIDPSGNCDGNTPGVGLICEGPERRTTPSTTRRSRCLGAR